MRNASNSGAVKIFDWSAVGRIHLNRSVEYRDHDGICCSTNYSAVWDSNDELIVLAVENLLCAESIDSLIIDAMASSQLWESLEATLSRVKLNPNRINGDVDYNGNFPGSINAFVDPSVLMKLRRCLHPFLGLALNSSQFRLQREVLSAEDITSFVNDSIDFCLAGKNCQSWIHERFMHSNYTLHGNIGENRKNIGQEFEVYDHGEAEERISSTLVRNLDSSNPAIPRFSGSFWASASLNPENLSIFQSSPHVDEHSPGLASIFTLTNNSIYEVTGTSFHLMRCNKSNIMMHYGAEYQGLHNNCVESLQIDALNRNESAHSGWMNGSGNRFADVIALSYNKFNRLAIYPSNRLHTAYIPDAGLLSSNPSEGRLTLNAFWETFTVSDDFFCDGLVKNRDIGSVHFLSNEPRTVSEYIRWCNWCTSWGQVCAWDTENHKCIHNRKNDNAGADNLSIIVGKDGTSSDAICSRFANESSTCMSLESCNACSMHNSCTWCIDEGICRLRAHRACKRPNFPSHIQDNECELGARAYDCSKHRVAETCRKARCAWCQNLTECRSSSFHACDSVS